MNFKTGLQLYHEMMRSHQKWTKEEIADLRLYFPALGARSPIEGRSKSAIRRKARELGLSHIRTPKGIKIPKQPLKANPVLVRRATVKRRRA